MDKQRTLFEHSRPLLCAGLAIGIVGCTSPGSRSGQAVAESLPTAWHSALPSGSASGTTADAQSLGLWWQSLKDPVLNKLIENALRTSPDVQTALSRISEYRWARVEVRSQLFPSVSANVSASGTRTKDREFGGVTHQRRYEASVDATWQLDLFGQQRAVLAVSSAQVAQNEELYYASQVSLAAEVASAYVSLRSAEAQLVVVEHSLVTRGETVQLTRWREQAGMGDVLDTQQSVAALEQARSTIPLLQLSLVQLRNQLALLAGLNPGALDPLLNTPGPIPPVPLSFAMGIPAEVLRQRPDVCAAQRFLEAAFARTLSAKRARFPSLSLSGSVGVEALKAGHLGNPEYSLASFVAALGAPLFQAGKISAHIQLQREQEQQAKIAYETIVRAALAEVENALASVQWNSERLVILENACSAAREAAKLSALQFEAGGSDLLVSLEAQRTLLGLEQQALTTAADRTGAYIQLYKALGGGWTHL